MIGPDDPALSVALVPTLAIESLDSQISDSGSFLLSAPFSTGPGIDPGIAVKWAKVILPMVRCQEKP